MTEEEVLGKKVLKVSSEALTALSEQAFIDISHLLRPAHLQVSIHVYVFMDNGYPVSVSSGQLVQVLTNWNQLSGVQNVSF